MYEEDNKFIDWLKHGNIRTKVLLVGVIVSIFTNGGLTYDTETKTQDYTVEYVYDCPDYNPDLSQYKYQLSETDDSAEETWHEKCQRLNDENMSWHNKCQQYR